MDQFLVICALTQFLVGIEKLSHKQQILSQQYYFGKIYVIRAHVCYVKLSRKRPNFEKTQPAWTSWDSSTIFTPVKSNYHKVIVVFRYVSKISNKVTVLSQSCLPQPSNLKKNVGLRLLLLCWQMELFPFDCMIFDAKIFQPVKK